MLLLWLGLLVSLTGAFVTPSVAIIGAAAGYAVFWLFAHLFLWITGKEGLGNGDFKLLAAIGAWVGYSLLPLVVLLAALLGTLCTFTVMIVKRKDLRGVPIPFGPFLIVGGFVCLLWGMPILHTYFAIFQ